MNYKIRSALSKINLLSLSRGTLRNRFESRTARRVNEEIKKIRTAYSKTLAAQGSLVTSLLSYKVRAELTQSKRKVKAEVKQMLTSLLASADVETFRKNLYRVLYETNEEAFMLGIKTALRDMGFELITKAKGVEFNLTDQEILNSLHTRASDVSRRAINSTRRKYTTDVYTEIFEQGTSIQDVVIQLERETGDAEYAWLVAQTEIQTFLGTARHEMFSRSGVQRKRWLTVGDDRVREEHTDNEDQGWIPIDDAFSNGAMHPGDGPSAVNCFLDPQVGIWTSLGRKDIGDIKVGDLVLTHTGEYKRVLETYLGKNMVEAGHPITRITFGEKNKVTSNSLTVTDEHPMLTQRGWVLARDLMESDSLCVMATRCPVCNTKKPHYRKYCSRSCGSWVSATQQWASDTHRKNISKKTSAQLRREYKRGTRDPFKIVRAAREECFRRYGEGGYAAVAQIWKKGKVACFNLRGRTSIEREYKKRLLEEGRQFQEQYRVGPYFVDFYIPSKKLFVETDGWYWHQDPEKTASRDLDILKEYPDHEIEHRVYGRANDFVRAYRRSLLTLNHVGAYEFIYVDVKKVTHAKTTMRKRLYNFLVEGNHSYVANGAVSHNCRCIEEADLEDPNTILDPWVGGNPDAIFSIFS